MIFSPATKYLCKAHKQVLAAQASWCRVHMESASALAPRRRAYMEHQARVAVWRDPNRTALEHVSAVVELCLCA